MAKYRGIGTLIKRGNGDGPPETFTTIAGARDVAGPALTREIIDVTSQESSGDYAEKMPGPMDAGKVTFALFWNPAGATHDEHTGLVADFNAGVARSYQLYYPDAGHKTCTFEAFVTSFAPTGEVKGMLTAAVELDITGVPNWS